MTLATNVGNLATRIATEFKAIRTLISGSGTGGVGGLETTATNLVDAINEVNDAVGASSGIDDEVTGLTTTWSSTKIDGEITSAVDGLVDAAPGALDTLNELAAALGDDADFAGTMTTALAAKAPLASPALTGTPTAPTAAGGTNTTQIATTAFVVARTPAASTTASGIVELADNTETQTGTDTVRAVTPAGLLAVTGAYNTNYVTTFEAGLA